MALVRAALSEADRRFIIGRSAGCCNRCKMPVFVDNEFGERARLGDDAHIWAYSADGPRGGGAGAPGNRNERENIILLCKNCHALVDQQPSEFTPSMLTTMREEHYRWAEWCLGATRINKPKLHYILYLNLPRVDMYAVANSIPLPRTELGSAQCFRELGIGSGRVMANYSHVLSTEGMYAHPIGGQSSLSELEPGRYCFVEPMNFRTVAIGRDANLQKAWASNRSVIYRKFGDWKLTCLIDPRWLTTSTAESTLMSGRAQLCGVLRINWIDSEAKNVNASPLFLAQSGGIFDDY